MTTLTRGQISVNIFQTHWLWAYMYMDSHKREIRWSCGVHIWMYVWTRTDDGSFELLLLEYIGICVRQFNNHTTYFKLIWTDNGVGWWGEQREQTKWPTFAPKNKIIIHTDTEGKTHRALKSAIKPRRWGQKGICTWSLKHRQRSRISTLYAFQFCTNKGSRILQDNSMCSTSFKTCCSLLVQMGLYTGLFTLGWKQSTT